MRNPKCMGTRELVEVHRSTVCLGHSCNAEGPKEKGGEMSEQRCWEVRECGAVRGAGKGGGMASRWRGEAQLGAFPCGPVRLVRYIARTWKSCFSGSCRASRDKIKGASVWKYWVGSGKG